MRPPDDTRETSVGAHVRQFLPKDCDPDRAAELVAAALRVMVFSHASDDVLLMHIGHLVRYAVELGAMHANEPVVLLDRSVCRRFAREMFIGIDTLLGEEVTEGALPPNVAHVTARNGTVSFLAGKWFTVTKGEALHMAAWLIAVADPSLKLAPALLVKVATRQ